MTVAAVLVAAEEPLVDWDWIDRNRDDIRDLFVEHLTLTGVAVGIGFVIALALALVATRWRWTYGPLAGLAGIIYSIPSLALFALLLPITGLGFRTAEIALIGYTQLVLLRNIVAGLDGVPAAAREAADGMGYERWRRVLRVDLPLAAPTVIAGLRIATVTTVGLVTVTALVGEGGFGDLITRGLDQTFSTPVMVGTVLSVALAVAFDLAFVGVERLVAPWNIRSRREVARG